MNGDVLNAIQITDCACFDITSKNIYITIHYYNRFRSTQ